MAETVKIVLDAEDNASAAIRDVGDELSVLASTAMKENLLDLKDAGAGALSAIGDAALELSKLAAEDELVAMRLRAQLAALGDTAAVGEEDISRLADELSRVSGFDDEALVQGQTTLLRFGSLSREQFEQATRAAADLAAITGMDLASAFQQVGIALDNPEQGFGRLSRQIGDLTAEQRAAVQAALDMGDVATAQGIILDALAQKVEGAASAYGETFTGKVGIARTQIDNLKSSIGDLINQNLPQWMVTTGMAAAEANNMLGPILDNLANLLIVVTPLVKGGLLASLAATLKTALGGAITAIGSAIGAVSAPVLLLVAAIAALVAVLITLGPAAKQTLDMLVQIFVASFKRIEFEISAWFSRTRDQLISQAGEQFGLVGKAIVDGIFAGIKAAWPMLLGPAGLPLLLGNLLQSALSSINARSPSKVWADLVGEQAIAGGILVGVETGLKKTPIGDMLTPALAPAAAPVAGAQIVINYSPGISTASRSEFETQFIPLVNQALRQVRRSAG